MGFNYYNLGCLNPCKIENGQVIVHFLSLDKTVSFPCTLDVTIPEQSNYFVSNTVLFYLLHEGKEYIGRSDGRISIFDQKTSLLLGLKSWDAPRMPIIAEVGYWKYKATRSGQIVMPMSGEVAYAKGLHAEADMRKFQLNLATEFPFDLSYSAVEFSLIDNGFCMFTEGGEDYAIVPWILQADEWKSNIRNLL